MSDVGCEGMTETEMVKRTKAFALRIVRLVESLPAGRSADVIGKQLLRSGTSVGANYRAARRGRSRAEFLSKLGIVEEEADECAYWLELLIESDLVKPKRLDPLVKECGEITAIVVATIRSTRRNGK
jgi:four helix bundle protein